MRVTVLLKELREPRPKPLQSPKQTEAQGTKENTEEHGFIETKTFCASKDTIKKMKRQPAEQEKMLANEGSVSRIHKELPLINTHTHKTTKKGAKDSNILPTRHPPSHQACEEMLGSETPALPHEGDTTKNTENSAWWRGRELRASCASAGMEKCGHCGGTDGASKSDME